MNTIIKATLRWLFCYNTTVQSFRIPEGVRNPIELPCCAKSPPEVYQPIDGGQVKLRTSSLFILSLRSVPLRRAESFRSYYLEPTRMDRQALSKERARTLRKNVLDSFRFLTPYLRSGFEMTLRDSANYIFLLERRFTRTVRAGTKGGVSKKIIYQRQLLIPEYKAETKPLPFATLPTEGFAIHFCY